LSACGPGIHGCNASKAYLLIHVKHRNRGAIVVDLIIRSFLYMLIWFSIQTLVIVFLF
jgi:hypothetical protein